MPTHEYKSLNVWDGRWLVDSSLLVNSRTCHQVLLGVKTCRQRSIFCGQSFVISLNDQIVCVLSTFCIVEKERFVLPHPSLTILSTPDPLTSPFCRNSKVSKQSLAYSHHWTVFLCKAMHHAVGGGEHLGILISNIINVSVSDINIRINTSTLHW